MTFVDEDRQRQYTTLVLDAIGAERRAELERDMKLEHFPEPTDLEKRIFARGEARGRAEGIRHERALEREG